MRDIKFRAWEKYLDGTGEMYYNFFINSESGKYQELISTPYWDDGLRDVRNNRNIILMQYIGLKDKNGVEIFEGDIVTDGNEQQVIWDEKEWSCSCCNYVLGIYFSDSFRIEEIEVIGNIYEDAHLLNNK